MSFSRGSAVPVIAAVVAGVTGCSGEVDHSRAEASLGGADASGTSDAGASTGGRSADTDSGTSTGGQPPSGEGGEPCSGTVDATSVHCTTETGECGWSFNLAVPFLDGLRGRCEEFDQPGAPDPACDDLTIGYGMAQNPLVTFKGCCRPDGRCGILFENTSSCVANEDRNAANTPCGN